MPSAESASRDWCPFRVSEQELRRVKRLYRQKAHDMLAEYHRNTCVV